MLIFLALSLVQIINMLTTFYYLMGVGLGCKVEAMLLRFAVHGDHEFHALNLERDSSLMNRFLQSYSCEDNQDLWSRFLLS